MVTLSLDFQPEGNNNNNNNNINNNNEWTKKVNRVVSEIQTSNITDTNKLINATAIYITRQVGSK